MEAAARAPGLAELSPGFPGVSPGPEVPDGPGEPAEPPGPEEPQPRETEKQGPEEPMESPEPEGMAGPEEPAELEGAAGPEERSGSLEPGPEEPWEPPGPSEEEQPGAEEPPRREGAAGPEESRGPSEPRPEEPAGPSEPGPEEPPGPSEPRPEEPAGPSEPGPEEPPGPSEPRPEEPPGPEGVAGPEEPPGPSELERSVSTPTAGGAAQQEASGGAGEARGPAVPAAPGGAERRSGGAAAEQRDVAEQSEEERRERAALLERHRRLAAERERLRQTIARLELRLGERLRLQRGESRPPAALGADGPRLYAQQLLQLLELREERERLAESCRERAAALRQDAEERRARAEAAWAAFQARKKAVAVPYVARLLGSRQAATALVDSIQATEQAKEEQVREARAENIKLKQEIQTLETILKAHGKVVESQQLTDFEHMKKENQKHNEKIDGLCNEILKLRKKISTTENILSQVKEKLHFVEAENKGRKVEVMNIEVALSQKRDLLTKAKQARDRLRRNNVQLQQKCGLLGDEVLLRDFEEKADTAELLSQRLETLQQRHAALVLACRRMQKKIKEASSYLLPQADQSKESMKKK
ncbi:coiled-coil domain-containing protein 96 [Colius striatus]|uniref:coiled-coil domain-containing protein 96 n=1 Tax=Colius striatus TaxID=57412 RepID=UPI002B1E74E2|nr:coiled-coil domain-containing protein 96 [Colius striatus]